MKMFLNLFKDLYKQFEQVACRSIPTNIAINIGHHKSLDRAVIRRLKLRLWRRQIVRILKEQGKEWLIWRNKIIQKYLKNTKAINPRPLFLPR